MRFSIFAAAAVLSTVGATPLKSCPPGPPGPPGAPGPAAPPSPPTVGESSSAKTDALAAEGASNLQRYLQANGGSSTTCTKENVAVRREW